MKINKKQLEKLVMEGLMKEIRPNMAAKAVGPALSKGDPRSKAIVKDAITSMFSKYIGRKMPFNFIARDDGSPVEYELVEVLARINWVEPGVEFHFYNSEGVENDKPFALNKKNIVITYDIKNDELIDSQSGRFHWILNPFTSKFLAKASNEIREMYYTAMPEKILDPQEDKYIINPNFNMKSKINKNDFQEFAYDSKAMSLSEGVDTGNPYDLNNPDNLENFYRKAAEAWTVYCGQSANDAGVANDNRVLLYNLVESGEFAEKMNQIWSPNGLNVNKDGSDYYTNNPEDMEAHLEKMGYSKGDYTLSPGAAGQDRFEQPYNNPETREGRMPLDESEIRKIVRRALK